MVITTTTNQDNLILGTKVNQGKGNWVVVVVVTAAATL